MLLLFTTTLYTTEGLLENMFEISIEKIHMYSLKIDDSITFSNGKKEKNNFMHYM